MEEALSGCFGIFEKFGLQYFSLKSLTKENADKRVSTLRTICMLVVVSMLLLLQVGYLMGSGTSTKNVTAKTVLMFTITNIINMCLIFVAAVSLIESYTKTKLTKKIFLNSNEISSISDKEFNTGIDFIMIRKLAIKKFSKLLIFFILTQGISIIYNGSIVLALIESVLTIFLILVALKFSFQVSFMVNFHLEFLESLLQNMFKKNKIENLEVLNISIQVIKPVERRNDVSRKLLAAKNIYNIIYENSTLINASNGLSMLLLLMLFVTLLTMSGYELFILLIGDLETEKLVPTVYNIVYGLAFLLETVNCCQKNCNIMGTLIASVKKIECGNYGDLDNDSRELLDKFYVQLNLQPIQFTTLGFFTINQALLASIITGIISYQIILVQFHTA